MGVFFMPAIWVSGAQAFCPAPASLPVAQVQRVVDGDTLRLSDGRSVRMIGLNTPETGKKGQSAEPFAEAAKRRLQALVDESGGQIGLRVGQQGKDHYGRTLANVYDRKGANLEVQLLSEGLGYLVAVAPNVALVDCQQVAERAARQAQLGVWRDPPVQPSTRLSKSGFAIVSGQVKSVQPPRDAEPVRSIDTAFWPVVWRWVAGCSRFRHLSVKSNPVPIDSSGWPVLLGLCILRILGGPSVPQ
ncbi:nuclease -like proteinue [Pseudomonas savastanoi pv. phaseolicola]|nr:nuclease -like proteinue [Pseudomonas savastanoi pv. phaseolicola]KPB64849.1 nuclease -like proteinue [Pseudomonas amygdali pv. mellea]